MFLLAGCGESGDTPCSDTNPCIEGYSCTKEGICEKADALGITTESLPQGSTGLEYTATVSAKGGLPPYTWSVDTKLEWVQVRSLSDTSGQLHGMPDAPTAGTVVTVSVTDNSYGSGQTVSKELSIKVLECVDGVTIGCYHPEDQNCLNGTQTCTQGVWDVCEGGTLSRDMDHCDDDCSPCDPDKSDSCDGVCKCGTAGACTGKLICCNGYCTDPTTDIENCGGCSVDCTIRVHGAEEELCLDVNGNGRCDYTTCSAERFDCNGDRTDGCESLIDARHCGGCDLDCIAEAQHAVGIGCEYDPDSESYNCSLGDCEPDWGNCDDNPNNGCEQSLDVAEYCGSCDVNCTDGSTGTLCLYDDQAGGYFRCGCTEAGGCTAGLNCCDNTCVPEDHQNYCGSCDVDCLHDPRGDQCLDPASGTCGCNDPADCPDGEYCCNHVCTAPSTDNCGACGRRCTPQNGGPTCDLVTETCYCEADEDCNLFAEEQHTCEGEGTAARCVCGIEDVCDGTLESVCCPFGDPEKPPTCVDATTDTSNCGGCGSTCLVGHGSDCVYGSCLCTVEIDPIPCPSSGPGTDCDMGHCVCATFGPGEVICPEGRYCCDGTSGGTGGQGGLPDEGCCLHPCGTNTSGDCIFS
jgi:hypothetical protein